MRASRRLRRNNTKLGDQIFTDEDLDNDLMKSLSEIPPMKLASIDEAFIILDSGLGAIFSACMARRAAVTKQEDKPNPLRGKGAFKEKAADGPGSKGTKVFKRATQRIVAPLQQQRAQKTTLRMLNDLVGPHTLGNHADHKSRASARASFAFDENVFDSMLSDRSLILGPEDCKKRRSTVAAGQLCHTVSAGHELLEDPLFRDWAQDELDLDPDRLRGLESSAHFRSRLAHQMLCWQTLRADKLDYAPATPMSSTFESAELTGTTILVDSIIGDESELTTIFSHRSESEFESKEERLLSSQSEFSTSSAQVCSETSKTLTTTVGGTLDTTGESLKEPPHGFTHAQRSLFGLTHHLDAQRMRRSRSRAQTPREGSEAQGTLPEAGEDVEKSARSSTAKPKWQHRNSSRERPDRLPPFPARPSSMQAVKSSRGETRSGDAVAASAGQGRSSTRAAFSNVAPAALQDEDQDRVALHRRLPSHGQTRDAPLGVALRLPPPFVEPHFEMDAKDVGHTPELTYFRCCESMGLVPCPAVWRNFADGKGIIDASQRSLRDSDLCAVMETAVRLASDGHQLQTLDLSTNAFSDVGMQHVASFVLAHPAACSMLSTISLAGNAGVRFQSEETIAKFSEALLTLPALDSLDLSGVPIYGLAATKLCASLQESLSLKKLSLAGCGLGRLDQSECVAAAALVGARAGGQAGLEYYDLSANFFGCIGFGAVAKALHGSKLKSFSVAGNCIRSEASANCREQLRYHPIQLMLEGFLFNTDLTEVNLSSCGIGPDSAFVLEDAFHNHPALTCLDISDNPLGDAGIRCVLRLLLEYSSPITVCEMRNHREADATAHPIKFRYAQPSGIYRLQLKYPHDRAALRTLLRTSERVRTTSAFANTSPFRFFKFDPKVEKPSMERDEELDRWVIPSQGVCNFTFRPPLSESAERQAEKKYGPRKAVVERPATKSSSRSSSPVGTPLPARESVAPSPLASPVGTPHSFDAGLASGTPTRWSQPTGPPSRSTSGRAGEWCETPKLSEWPETPRPDLATTEGEPFEENWKEVTLLLFLARMKVPQIRYPLVRKMFLSFITGEQQLRFIHACSKDMAFNGPQVSQLCEDRPEIAVQILCCLFPSMRGRTPQLLLLNSVKAASWPAVTHEVSRCIWFHEGNMTGRYNLDLEKPADYAVAENCLIGNAWESEVGRLLGWPDISQRGTYEMLRNESHNEVRFNYNREWMLPSHGWFRFDYSSVRRPRSDGGKMTEAGEVTRYLQRNSASSEAKLKALRAISVHMHLSSQQFRNLLLCFPAGEFRQEIFCAFHSRVTDWLRLLSHEVLHCKNLLSGKDRVSLVERVGCLHLLNPLHPERVWFKCNLTVYEERRLVDFLVQLREKEPGSRITGHGTTYRNGIPASWAGRGVPNEDITLSCAYQAKYPNVAWRQELASKYSVGRLD